MHGGSPTVNSRYLIRSESAAEGYKESRSFAAPGVGEELANSSSTSSRPLTVLATSSSKSSQRTRTRWAATLTAFSWVVQFGAILAQRPIPLPRSRGGDPLEKRKFHCPFHLGTEALRTFEQCQSPTPLVELLGGKLATALEGSGPASRRSSETRAPATPLRAVMHASSWPKVFASNYKTTGTASCWRDRLEKTPAPTMR